jgi:hypothetical protein
VQLIYRLVFLNSKFSYHTYLPSVLDYAEVQSRLLQDWLTSGYDTARLDVYKRSTQGGKSLYL